VPQNPTARRAIFRRCVVVPGPQERSVSLNICLLEGDSVAETRARHGKRRAILVSIVLQILIVTALLLIPLLGKSENIAGRIFVPTVPYAPAGQPHHDTIRPTSVNHPPCHICAPTSIPPHIVTSDPVPANTDDGPEGEGIIPGAATGPGVPGGAIGVATHVEPPPPPPVTPTTVRVSALVQAAMLIHRVQPIYPPLAMQTRREGRVELHAIIATDGTIQSLEVVSGDPFFLQSAMAAVREWRYRPTILNGQPVEVDTHITVIYTLSH
jgi:protein TonB